MLIAKGADLQYCTRAEGKTALMHAAYNGAAACVNVLLDKLFDRQAASAPNGVSRGSAGC